jgi:hypothetical protein
VQVIDFDPEEPAAWRAGFNLDGATEYWTGVAHEEGADWGSPPPWAGN